MVVIVGLKVYYQDEFIFGLEQVLNKQWFWGVKGIYCDLKNVIDDMCVGFLCCIFNLGLGVMFKVLDGNGGYIYIMFIVEQMGLFKFKCKYYVVDLFVVYQDVNFYGKVLYIWLCNYGNVEGQFNLLLDIGMGGQFDVSILFDWDLLEIMEGVYGVLLNNYIYVVKLFGFYWVNDEWCVGGLVILQSGLLCSCMSWYLYVKVGLYNLLIYYYYCGVFGNQIVIGILVILNMGYVFLLCGIYGMMFWIKMFNVSVVYLLSYVKGLML